MAKVSKSKHVAAPPREVWEKIGDFHGLHLWNPAMKPTESVNDGRGRRIDFGNAAIVEELLESGDSFYTYRIVEGPLPVKEYRSTLRVRPEGDGSVVEWEGTFEPSGVPEEQAVAIVDGIYSSGLANL